MLSWHGHKGVSERRRDRKLDSEAAGRRTQKQLISPAALFLELDAGGEGKVKAPEQPYGQPLPAEDFPIDSAAVVSGGDAECRGGRNERKRRKKQNGGGVDASDAQSQQRNQRAPPPLLSTATFAQHVQHHHHHYRRTSERCHLGVRHLMPDVVYQHIIRCLQDPGHLVAMKAKESERKLCNHLKSLVTRNCRFYLYYTDIKHPVQLGTSVLGPVLYACINSNFEMHPPFPRGEGHPQVVRVIPMSQVEAVIENAFKQFRCRIGAISSFIKQQYACVPDELVQTYRHFSPDMTRHHAITRVNKQRLRPIRALYPRARYTLDLVDCRSQPDNSRVITDTVFRGSIVGSSISACSAALLCPTMEAGGLLQNAYWAREGVATPSLYLYRSPQRQSLTVHVPRHNDSHRIGAWHYGTCTAVSPWFWDYDDNDNNSNCNEPDSDNGSSSSQPPQGRKGTLEEEVRST
jgi:hypothetical protein